MNKQLKNDQLKNERGFTLLELLLVVGVGALLLVGAITTYQLVSENNQAAEANRMLLTMKQETQALYQTRADYSGITLATLQTLNAVPENGRHPFNGPIAVSTADAPGGTSTEDGFEITFEDVPESGCAKLATSGFSPSDLFQVQIGTASPRTTQATMTDVAALIGECEAQSGTSGSTDISWSFR